MLIECPHCGKENNIDTKEFCAQAKKTIFVSHICQYCDKTFEMYSEGHVEALLIKETCDCCGHSWDVKHMNGRGQCFPFPLNPEYNNICPSCFARAILFDLEARNDYRFNMGSKNIEYVKSNFKPGDMIQITKILDPYRVIKSPITLSIHMVENNGTVIVRLDNGDYWNLYYGYDTFEKV